MPERFQSEKKQAAFSVMHAAVMRQVIMKLLNVLQCIVSSVNRTTANDAHGVMLR